MDDLRTLLQRYSLDELAGLATILNLKDANIDSIIDGFWWNCQHTAYYCLGYQPSYLEIVRQVASHLKVPYTTDDLPSQIEITIAQVTLQTLWERMTPEQRQAMEEQWRKTAQEFGKIGSVLTSGSIFAALTAAQLSGFGIYLLASTSLYAITGMIGLTLPFAVYTTMSSAIAVIIGPVGWIGAGLLALWMLNGPNYKRLVPAVLYVCMLRARQSLGDGTE